MVALALACLTFPFIGMAEARKLEPGEIVEQVVAACAAADGTLVYIPGRSFVAITGPSGDFELGSVPPGTYALHVQGENPASWIDLTGVVVDPGLTTNLDPVNLGVDLTTDPSNCGACGNACVAGLEDCVAGYCGIACSSPSECPSGWYCDFARGGLVTPIGEVIRRYLRWSAPAAGVLLGSLVAAWHCACSCPAHLLVVRGIMVSPG